MGFSPIKITAKGNRPRKTGSKKLKQSTFLRAALLNNKITLLDLGCLLLICSVL